MLAFTLSKFSLIVMVVAVASIIGFFSLHLNQSLSSVAITNLLEKYSVVSSEMVSSPSYCDSIRLKIPDTIKLSGSEMYYVMKISVLEAAEQEGQKYLIFSAAERRKPGELIASSSIVSNSEIVLYSRAGGKYSKTGSITLDPLARTDSGQRANAFYLVKEIGAGKTFLYIFPCIISYGQTSDCDQAKIEVGKIVNPGLGVFKCG